MATGITNTNITSDNKEIAGNFKIEYTYLDTSLLGLTKTMRLSYKDAVKEVHCEKPATLAQAKDFILRLRKAATSNVNIALVHIYVYEIGEAKGRHLRYWDWRSSENI